MSHKTATPQASGAANDVADDTWHHYALSWRKADGAIAHYLDGALFASATGVATGCAIPTVGSSNDEIGIFSAVMVGNEMGAIGVVDDTPLAGPLDGALAEVRWTRGFWGHCVSLTVRGRLRGRRGRGWRRGSAQQPCSGVPGCQRGWDRAGG